MSFLIISLMLVAIYFVSVAMHELGHFVAFRLGKVSVRMLNIAFVSFIFNGERWKVAFNHNGSGVGGIVVPNLTTISNEEEFKAMQKAYSSALLGGPIVNLLLILTGGLMSTQESYLGIAGNILFFLNALMFLSCFIKMGNVYGDFPAYKVYKTDDFFAALMMYQYASFAVDYKQVMVNNTYLKGHLLKGLIPRIESRQTDVFTVSCVASFLEEYLTGITDKLAEPIPGYINYYYDHYETIIDESDMEANKELLFYTAYYFEKEGLSERAIDIYENFIQQLPKSEAFDYRKIQSEQLILGEDHSKYLLNKSNIKPNSNYNVFKKLEGFYHYELLLNKNLDKQRR